MSGSRLPRSLRRKLLPAGIALGGALLLTSYLHASMTRAPADLDLSRTRLSAGETFRATITPNVDPIPLHRLHSWTLHLETADGRPIEAVPVSVHGGMPQHGHGLPTQPKVTRALGNGDHLVEGMKFSMGGWWIVTFAVADPAGADSVTFNLKL